jgi:hypothetical protein
MTWPSIGETSSKVSALATRFPSDPVAGVDLDSGDDRGGNSSGGAPHDRFRRRLPGDIVRGRT